MAFDSFSEFLAMGRHGFYVWLVYGAAVVVVLINVIGVRRERLQVLAALQRRHALGAPSAEIREVR